MIQGRARLSPEPYTAIAISRVDVGCAAETPSYLVIAWAPLALVFQSHSHVGPAFKDLSVHLKESSRGREGQRDPLSAVSLPTWLQQREPGPGARSFLWFSHVGAGAKAPGPSSAAFPSTSAGIWKWSSRVRTGAYMGCRCCRQWLTPLCPSAGPGPSFLVHTVLMC